MNMLCGGCTELAKVLLDRGADPTLKVSLESFPSFYT